ncbi:MAG: MFS transporter [Bacteroidetes bacterium]|nr:MFS transporter [Bacteroidota bacterium]
MNRVVAPHSLGLKANRHQFLLLVLINAFVGGMVGLERTILPQIAEQEFQIAAKSAIFSFIVVFGIVKAFGNYLSGYFSERIGKKNLLIIGWIFGLPVPFILMMADNWNWIVAANVFLGINQGLAWSTTVMMKIDLVGEKNRGLAMGLNEFAGYLAVSVAAFLTGWIAANYGLRPAPFYMGVGFAVAGLLLTVFFVKDTRHHVAAEAQVNTTERLKNVFMDTTFRHKNLSSITQAGLINNLNDGMVWGMLPVLLFTKEFSLADIGLIVAVYPAVWGIGQLLTGKMADFFCKKSMLSWGMMLQGLALLMLVFISTKSGFIFLMALLGWGTAMVYPSFLATVADNTHPKDRAKSMGIFRLWRDLGYSIGAILTGFLADAFGIDSSILAVAFLTLASGYVIEKRMSCKTESMKITPWILSFFNRSRKKGNSRHSCVSTAT